METVEDTPAAKRHQMLTLSTAAFTACFAIWTIFSIIGIRIKEDLGLNDTEFGILVATPMLTGSLLCVPFGAWVDYNGGKLPFLLLLIVSAGGVAGLGNTALGLVARKTSWPVS